MDSKALNFQVKTFSQLTTKDLYEILRLRSTVFVVEQSCNYLDLDGKDFLAYHVLAHKDDKLIGYSRFFAKGDYYANASFGRVAIYKDYRGKGRGRKLVVQTLAFIYKYFGTVTIEISAQQYLKMFYADFGFEQLGKVYLEDGIPHLKMLLKP